MPYKKVFIRISMLFLISWYLTFIVLINTNSKISDFIFVFLYFSIILFFLFFILVNLFHKKIFRESVKRKAIIISSVLTVLTLLCCGNFIFPTQYVENTLRITALARSNIDSKGMEIWINDISIDSQPYELSSIQRDKDWKYHADSNTITAYPNNLETSLDISLPAGNNIEITFSKHAWSGIVRIEHKSEISTIDLYDSDSSHATISIQGATLKYTPIQIFFY